MTDRQRIPRRPRLKPTVEVLQASDGRIYLLRSGDEEDLVIEHPDPCDGVCLELLDGTRSVAGVADALTQSGFAVEQSALASSIADLAAAGVLDDAADEDRLDTIERDRYSRQLLYLGEMVDPGGSRADAHLRLRASSVAVVGVGGLGGAAALALASAGIGRLDLIDGDVVELSNLNRQVLYTEADVGRRKAIAAADRLARLNSGIEVRPCTRFVDSAAAAMRILDGVDFVVDAADWPVHEIGRWVNQACLQHGTPHVTASLYPPYMRVGPLFVPGVTGCLACQEESFRCEAPLYDEVVEMRRGRPSIGAPFGPTCCAVGSLVAQEVAHYLSGATTPATLGAALTYDLRTGAVERTEVLRVEACSECGTQPIDRAIRPPRGRGAAGRARDGAVLSPSPRESGAPRRHVPA